MAEFLHDLHGRLLLLSIIVEDRHPEVEECIDFYDLCLSEAKDYMNATSSLRLLVAT